MKPVTLRHKNGNERVATTPAERVAAEYDGYVEVQDEAKDSQEAEASAAKAASGANANDEDGGPDPDATHSESAKAAPKARGGRARG